MEFSVIPQFCYHTSSVYSLAFAAYPLCISALCRHPILHAFGSFGCWLFPQNVTGRRRQACHRATTRCGHPDPAMLGTRFKHCIVPILFLPFTYSASQTTLCTHFLLADRPSPPRQLHARIARPPHHFRLLCHAYAFYTPPCHHLKHHPAHAPNYSGSDQPSALVVCFFPKAGVVGFQEDWTETGTWTGLGPGHQSLNCMRDNMATPTQHAIPVKTDLKHCK